MADRDALRPSIDEAIDRTVRQMMDVDARPGFERRVMRRVAEPPVAAFPILRVAAATALVATVIIAAFLLRSTPEHTAPAHPEPIATSKSPAPATPTSRVPTTAQHKPSTATLEIRERRAPRARPQRIVVAATADPAEDAALIATVPALDGPGALALREIEHRSVTIPDIRMAGLEIRGLHVEPLPASDEGGKE